ncbi:MAG: hypothetical protein LBN05_02380 [Oscillospiraceae bacterium]|jgi:hypothetical protein|nr:hypothetical protein [Oscillospiraceae bacterium]
MKRAGRLGVLCLTLLLLVVSLSGCTLWEELHADLLFYLPFLQKTPDWETPPTTPAPAVPTPDRPVPAPSRHYYARLTPRQQHAYLAILAALPDFPERVEIPKMDSDALAAVIEAYSYDNPAQYNLGEVYTLVTQGNKTYFQPDYRFAQALYADYSAAVEREKQAFLATVQTNVDDFALEKAVHDFLVARIDYTNDGSAAQSTPYGALVLGKAACEGYARAAKMLLDALGVENMLRTGTATNSVGKSESHMWNTVRVDGVWTNLDVTWDDPVVSDDAPGGVRYDYFNLSDAELGRTHRAATEIVACTQTDANFFVHQGLYFTEYSNKVREKISAALGANLRQGVYTLSLRFADADTAATTLESLTNARNGAIYRMLQTHALSAPQAIDTGKILFSQNENLHILRFFVQTEDR